MGKPMTQEEVEKLRLPEGFEIIDELDDDERPYGFIYLTADDQKLHVAHVACGVANGALPPAALDALWAVLDGKELVEVKRCGTCKWQPQCARLLDRMTDNDFCSRHKEKP